MKNNNFELDLLKYLMILFIDCNISSFISFCNEVAKKAKEITNSTLSLLYLTYDHKILEAVGRSGDPLDKLEAAQIPFYRLDWDIPEGYEDIYDGFTAWAALNIKNYKPAIYFLDDLREHKAHKGQWDPIVWGGKSDELKAIMFLPLVKVDNVNNVNLDTLYHLFGLLKVEISVNDAIQKHKFVEPFRKDEQIAFENLVKFLTDILSFDDNNTWKKFWQLIKEYSENKNIDELLQDNSHLLKEYSDSQKKEEFKQKIKQLSDKATNSLILQQLKKKFWQLLAEYSETQKPQQLMAILKGWRSVEYNLTEGIGFIMEFFRVRAGRDFVIYILPYKDPWKFTDEYRRNDIYNTIYIMPYWRPSWRKLNPKPYFRLELDKNIINFLNEFEEREVISFFYLDKALRLIISKLMSIVNIEEKRNFDLNIKVTLDKKNGNNIGITIEELNPNEKMGIVVNNNICELKINKACIVDLSAGKNDFGKIILPLNENEEIDIDLYRNLVSEAVSFTRILSRTFRSMFKIRKSTFLPFLYPSGSRNLIISFIDIRNFSTVTRILRLMGQDKLIAIELFMEHFCRIVSLIANEWGRLDKFMGDGAMIIYGEDILSSNINLTNKKIKQAILSSICASIAILLAFNKLYELWLSDKLSPQSLPWRFPTGKKIPLLKNIKYEHCEDINLDLGISLNYGIVYMDYFGDTYERQYTAIGDNVNLCARLCNEASRYDKELKRKRAPILITQPIFEYIKEFLTEEAKKREPLRLQFRGLGIDYPIWELWPIDISYGNVGYYLKNTPLNYVFKNTFKNENWDFTDFFIQNLLLYPKYKKKYILKLIKLKKLKKNNLTITVNFR